MSLATFARSCISSSSKISPSNFPTLNCIVSSSFSSFASQEDAYSNYARSQKASSSDRKFGSSDRFSRYTERKQFRSEKTSDMRGSSRFGDSRPSRDSYRSRPERESESDRKYPSRHSEPAIPRERWESEETVVPPRVQANRERESSYKRSDTVDKRDGRDGSSIYADRRRVKDLKRVMVNPSSSSSPSPYYDPSNATPPAIQAKGEHIFGFHSVACALISCKRRSFHRLYVLQGLETSPDKSRKEECQKIVSLASSLGVPLEKVSRSMLDSLSGNRPHGGYVMDSDPLPIPSIAELPRASSKTHGDLWIALDEVTDPQNFGAILRSAHFFGASGVVICASGSAPPTPVVSRASAGALEVIPLHICDSLVSFLQRSHSNGWSVVGTGVGPSAKPIDSHSPLNADGKRIPTILVIGSEGEGMRAAVRRACDVILSIPKARHEEQHQQEQEEQQSVTAAADAVALRQASALIDSLNVSVSTGVFLKHLSALSSLTAPSKIEEPKPE